MAQRADPVKLERLLRDGGFIVDDPGKDYVYFVSVCKHAFAYSCPHQSGLKDMVCKNPCCRLPSMKHMMTNGNYTELDKQTMRPIKISAQRLAEYREDRLPHECFTEGRGEHYVSDYWWETMLKIN